MIPLISIIVPTLGNRPAELRRAVVSALSGLRPDQVEVIVVPNGPASQWSNAVSGIEGMASVRVVSTEQRSVGAARNKGLEHARGQLVRFLDDDDFLVPEVAVRQYSALLASADHISTCLVRLEDAEGNHLGVSKVGLTNDLAEELLADRFQILTVGHVFRRCAIGDVRWNERLSEAEDVDWLHRLVRSQELSWQQHHEVGGIWFQHRGPRLSFGELRHGATRECAQAVLLTLDSLGQQSRLVEARKQAAVVGLWRYTHRAFFLRPVYWSRVAKTLIRMAPESRPDVPRYQRRIVARMHPISFEWIMTPPRLASHWVRSVRRSRQANAYQRQI